MHSRPASKRLALACCLLAPGLAAAHVCAPSPRNDPTAVWTGTELIVWGGSEKGEPTGNGARYDPVTDRWTPVGMVGAPAARSWHSAVWTGREMIVWGGIDRGGVFATGGRYDPTTDAWTPTSLAGVPPARYLHSAVWTGSGMLVHGGASRGQDPEMASGALYDPVADAWSFVPDAPEARRLFTATWTGTEMIVLGGYRNRDGSDNALNTGARYDPATRTWTTLPTKDAPWGIGPVLWTGKELLAWGGTQDRHREQPGRRFDPATHAWSFLPTAGAPSARSVHTVTWIGTDALLWGGYDERDGRHDHDDGARFDPATDQWTPITSVGAPTPRRLPVAAWTGKELLVWGGFDDSGSLASGARYDPARDAWTPISNLCTGHDE